MSFTAKYGGLCGACREWFAAGEEVEYDRTGALNHVWCPETTETALDIEAKQHAVCPRCFCRHPGEC